MKKRREPNKKTYPALPGVELYVEDTLMVKLRNMKDRGESPDNSKEIIYTDRRDGVIPGYNIRTDRFEAGLDALEKYGAYKAQEILKGQNATDGEHTGEQRSEKNS